MQVCCQSLLAAQQFQAGMKKTGEMIPSHAKLFLANLLSEALT
jgi:hypothetical protein